MLMYAFEVKGLSKHYGKLAALDGVTLAAEDNKIFGLLGPNGAGKTTIVRILSTLIRPDTGSATVKGLDVVHQAQAVRERIGLAGQYAAIDEFQTGYENIYMTGLLYGLPRQEAKKRTAELLQLLGLEQASNRPARTYSGGMRRRLDLGASLVGRPQVLFLDEPTTGLDPQSRIGIWQLVRELVREGASILLTTQYLEEADELADKIAIVDKGKVIAEGTSKQLKNLVGGDIIEFTVADSRLSSLAFETARHFAVQTPTFDASVRRVSVPVADASEVLATLVESLNSSGIKPGHLAIHQPSLDDVFLSLTGALGKSAPTEQAEPIE